MIILIDSSVTELQDIVDKSHKLIPYNFNEMPIMPYDSSIYVVKSQWVYSKAVDNDADLVIVKSSLIKKYLEDNGIKAISLT